MPDNYRNLATSQPRNLATSQPRNLATSHIAITALLAVSFSSPLFAFSFSDLFSSDKPVQTAQAEPAAVQTTMPVSDAQPVPLTQALPSHKAHHIKHKKHKKHHHCNYKKHTAAALKSVPAILPIFQPKNELTLFGGLTISSLTNGNDNVAINNIVTNTYDTNTATKLDGMTGLAYSRLFHLKHDMNMTIGPAFYYTSLDNVSGTEYPYSNAGSFDTLNYQLTASSVSVMAESRAIYEKYQWQPFITAGIGPSWNRLSSYSEVPTDPSGTATANPSVFQNNTQAAFAYDVGFGVQRIFAKDKKHDVIYNASLAYRYFNFGSAQLSPAAISTTGQAIKINTLDTQAILFSLGAMF